MQKFAFWMSSPQFSHFEIAQQQGFSSVVLDIEHGTFNLDDLDRIIPFCKARGIRVYAKVLGPQMEAIQQALDFGADGVIIPHIGAIDHARAVTATAKYPTLGSRSLSGARTMDYRAPAADDFLQQENRRTLCWPMIESADALADVEAIAALPTVDGLFVGPTDLALTRGRQRYIFGAEDQADLARIAAAANAVGKPWIMPAWTPQERAFAREHGASLMVVGAQFGIIRAGFETLIGALKDERLV